MSTTIQVSQDTKRRLQAYRDEIGAETYEDAIGHLLRTSGEESAFGAVPGWTPWDRSDRLTFRTENGADS
jgi:hypothetical protein